MPYIVEHRLEFFCRTSHLTQRKITSHLDVAIACVSWCRTIRPRASMNLYHRSFMVAMKELLVNLNCLNTKTKLQGVRNWDINWPGSIGGLDGSPKKGPDWGPKGGVLVLYRPCGDNEIFFQNSNWLITKTVNFYSDQRLRVPWSLVNDC